MEEKNLKRYLFWAFLISVTIVSFLIIRNYISAIITSFILSYLALPLQKRLSKHIPGKISALIIILSLIVLLGLATFFVIQMLVQQLVEFFRNMTFTSLLERAITFLEQVLKIDFNSSQIGQINQRIIEEVSGVLSAFLGSFFTVVINLIIIFFVSYYLLIDWENIRKTILQITPLKEKHDFYNEIGSSTKNMVYGYFLIAVIEFVIAAIGFFIAGINFYLLWAFLIFLAAFIPFIGPITIWLPIFIIQIASGNFPSAIIVLAVGLILSILIEQIFAQVLVGKRANIHPAIVMLGVIGGVPLFGVIGVIIGPLILNFIIKFISLYSK